jgi:hypothetical protein
MDKNLLEPAAANALQTFTAPDGKQYQFPATPDGKPHINTPELAAEFYAAGFHPSDFVNPMEVIGIDALHTQRINTALLQGALKKSTAASEDSELQRKLASANAIAEYSQPALTAQDEAASMPRSDAEYQERVRAAAVLARELGYELRELLNVPPMPCTTMISGPVYPALGLFPQGMGQVMYSGPLMALERRLQADVRARDAKAETMRVWADWESKKRREADEVAASTPEARIAALERKLELALSEAPRGDHAADSSEAPGQAAASEVPAAIVYGRSED